MSFSQNANLSEEIETENEDENGDDATVESSGVTAKNAWHPVWKSYELFKDEKSNDKRSKYHAKCLLKKANRKPCKETLHGWYTTNAMKHIKAMHVKEYANYLKNEWENKKTPNRKCEKNTIDKQQALLPLFVAKYLPQHLKQKIVTRKLAKAFVANSLATRLIENETFQEALSSLDDRYDIPMAHLLQKEEKLMFDAMKKNIIESMDNATNVAITVDIWTKRSGSESFIGATAHWFDRKSHRRKSATLAVRKIHSAHVASVIYQNVCRILELWGIPQSKVSKIVTDNGSNMVKAFQVAFQLAAMQEAVFSDFEPINDVAMGTAPGESAVLPQMSVNSDGILAGDDLMEMNEALEGDWRLDASFCELDDADIDQEIMEFNIEEQAMSDLFHSLQRLSCFAHSLQCCVQKLDKSKFASASRRKAFKLIESFSHSSKATQLLIEKTKKKLISACRTRWSYTCLALSRLMELKSAIAEVTDTVTTIDNLSNSEWLDIECYIRFMQPFADTTYSLEGNKYTTLSEIIPQLLELNHHLNQMHTVIGFVTASNDLLVELNSCFAFITDTTRYNFEPIYAIATSLDPRFRLVLNEEQLNAAKTEILQLLGIAQQDASQDGLPSEITCSGEEHQKDVSGRFKYVSVLIQQKCTRIQEQANSQDPILEEVSSYFNSQHTIGDNEDPLTFWTQCSSQYPKLSILSQDILIIPVTFAPVERLFSQASIAAGARRSRLSGDQLEREVMLKTNKQYF